MFIVINMPTFRTFTNMDDIRDIYDMDENYKLLSWEIPTLDIHLKLGDEFIVRDDNSINTFKMSLDELMYADDELGIHKVYPILRMGEGSRFYSLIDFVDRIRDKKITKLRITPTKNITPWTSTGQKISTN